MALHGPILVNGQHIGDWSAVRTPTPLDQQGRFTYNCHVALAGRTALLTVQHAYADGAAALAGQILTQGAKQLNEPEES